MSPIDRLAAAVAQLPSVRLAVLFGSHARGRAKPHSDIDVAVSLDPDTPETRKQLREVIAAAVPRAVDVVFARGAPPLLRMEVARYGRVLFERVPYAWADFKAEAMIDGCDFAPVARRTWAAAIERLRTEIARGPP